MPKNSVPKFHTPISVLWNGESKGKGVVSGTKNQDKQGCLGWISRGRLGVVRVDFQGQNFALVLKLQEKQALQCGKHP